MVVGRKSMNMLINHTFSWVCLFPFFVAAAQQYSNGNSTNFSFANFSRNNSQQLIYMGDANFSAKYDHIDLTPDPNLAVNISSLNESASNDLLNRNGRVLYHQPVTIWPASFTIFVKKITLIRNFNGDGIAFIIVPQNRRTSLAKSGGAFLGLFNQSTDGNTTGQLAIEFDTFHNEFDPIGNHVGIDISGIKSDATASLEEHGMDIQGGRAIQVRVDYDGWAKSLQIYARYADNTSVFVNILNRTVVLEKTVPGLAYVGFSATTGDSFEIHRILNWNFRSVALPKSSLKLSHGGLRSRVKVGVMLGSITVALVMVGLLGSWLMVRRLRRKNQAISTVPSHGSFIGELEIIQNTPHRFSYKELAAATNNFSEGELLGSGGFGSVYRGTVNAGGNEEVGLVAVKRIAAGSRQGEREFVSEISSIGRLRHRNIVQLQGWCHERGELLLVYDYMPNGSLDKFLYNRSDDTPFDWPCRHRILCGLGSALLYLHEEWEQRVIHRDVKPSNVMVDGKFNARLGDFGLARLMEHDDNSPGAVTLLAGTPGYLAPECSYTGKATTESDVFSFGVVLLEVVSGRRVVERKYPLAERYLVDWVWGLYSQGRILECADPKLKGFDYDEEQIRRVLILGLACSHPDPELRPSIRKAIQVLINLNEELPQLPSSRPLAIYVGSLHSHSTLFSSTSGDGATSSVADASRTGSITSSTRFHGR